MRRKLWIRLERTGKRQALQRDGKERRKWTTRCGFISMTSWSCLGMQYVATYVHKYIRTHMYVCTYVCSCMNTSTCSKSDMSLDLCLSGL